MLTLAGLLIGLAIGITGVAAAFSRPRCSSWCSACLRTERWHGAAVFFLREDPLRRRVHGAPPVSRTDAAAAARRGVPGAIAGPLLLKRFAAGKTEPWLLALVGATVCLTAGYSLLRSRIATGPRGALEMVTAVQFPDRTRSWVLLGGSRRSRHVLLSIGPILRRPWLWHGPVVRLAVSACAGGMHMAAGNWDANTLVKLLLGGVPGAVAGAQLAGRVPARPLRAIILSWAMLLGILLAWQALQKAT